MGHTNKTITVSVIIPTYNCLEYLPAALASIQQQDIPELEILVADDGSTDDTWQWLQDMQKKEPRLTSFKLGGYGPSKARNYCMRKAQGDYIAFLDADDLWYPAKLKKQLDFMLTNPSVVLSFTDYRHVNPAGDDLGGCYQFWPRFNRLAKDFSGYRQLKKPLSTLFAENIVGTSTVMVKREAILQVEGFDEALSSAEDWDLWLKLAVSGDVAFTNEIGMDYLMRPDSETSKTESRIASLKIIMERYQALAEIEDAQSKRLAQSRYLTAKAENYRLTGQTFQAFISHFRAFLLHPGKRIAQSMLVDFVTVFKPKKTRMS